MFHHFQPLGCNETIPIRAELGCDRASMVYEILQLMFDSAIKDPTEFYLTHSWRDIEVIISRHPQRPC
jgi:hypothetical protein